MLYFLALSVVCVIASSSFLPFKGIEQRTPEALWGTSQFDCCFFLDIVDSITTDSMTVALLGSRHMVAKQTKHISLPTQGFYTCCHIITTYSIDTHNCVRAH